MFGCLWHEMLISCHGEYFICSLMISIQGGVGETAHRVRWREMTFSFQCVDTFLPKIKKYSSSQSFQNLLFCFTKINSCCLYLWGKPNFVCLLLPKAAIKVIWVLEIMMCNGSSLTLIQGFADMCLSSLSHHHSFLQVISDEVDRIPTRVVTSADLFLVKMTWLFRLSSTPYQCLPSSLRRKTILPLYPHHISQE